MNNYFYPAPAGVPEELEIQTSTLRLSAKCWGNPEGMPVLAFHGWLDNAATFDHLAPYLKEFRLVSLDLPGHGLSEHRSSGSSYHFSDIIVDVLEVLHVLGWEHFSLLGHSMGAGVASYLAGTIPEKICSLILIEGLGSLAQDAEKMPEILRESAEQWQHLAHKKLPIYPDVETAVKVRHHVGGIEESSVRTLVARGLQPVDGGFTWRSDPRLKIKSRHYLTEEQACAFLEEITAPVLLIEAENSKQDQWKELLLKRIPYIKNLQHRKVSGDHHLHLDNPQEVAAVIREFLQQISEKA
ncbi:MAG: alpha/beta hydrolase [SAR324 cluster bacterium]|uniref:AB hydrolase-1 domain-containing protein n=1 Tax=marine metagenome TaxID=408172 RepID=A0A381PSK3_9ZZZZ|nr:alpha/beta hydrolase [SAR324 cluster bacterium]MDP6487947.1 alpha/beta hydrolase [SAR324 cluster bacterium]MDP7170220.1 alpha/beta hydrolase [SAR324 cluster bacterium]MDP7438837.1 alpha/beta hydrolase [SAR324 cluster bacterium]MDP7581934.1 alpha/beta hydrolase [SAR324 cluster bacterium]